MRLIDADALSRVFKGCRFLEEDAIIRIIQNAFTENEWIPVSEKLPEDMQDCLISTDENELLCAVFYDYPGHDFDFDTFDSDYTGEIIAWMPLPEPYKGGDTE